MMTMGRSAQASLAIGLVMVLGVVAVTAVFVTGREVTEPTPRTTSTLPVRERVDPEEFLAVWARSHVGPYAQSGSITRARGDTVEVTRFRRAAREGRELNQVGSTAIISEDGQQQICEVLDPEDIRCGGVEPAPTGEEQREMLAVDLAPVGAYLIFADPEPHCYWLVFDGAVGLGSRFGQETRMCFDPATGALVSQVERTGASEEALETLSLTADVTDADLEPIFLE